MLGPVRCGAVQVRQYSGCGGGVPINDLKWVCLDDLEDDVKHLNICCFGNKKNGRKSNAEHETGSDHIKVP